MSSDAPPQRRRLAARLRELRRRAGLTSDELAEAVGHAQSTISRVENAVQAPSMVTVERWCAAAGATADERTALLEMAEAVGSELVRWRRAGRHGLGRLQRDVRDVEASAAAIYQYNPLLVPGLLQAAEYARRVFHSLHLGRTDIAEAVAARLERQTILLNQTKRLEFVLGEAALRWRVGGPPVMLAQLERIATVAALSHVRVGVIPQVREAPVWPVHDFAIYAERADEPPIVTVETLTSGLTLGDPDDVKAYFEAFGRLRGAAVYDNEAATLLHELMAELRKERSA